MRSSSAASARVTAGGERRRREAARTRLPSSTMRTKIAELVQTVHAIIPLIGRVICTLLQLIGAIGRTYLRPATGGHGHADRKLPVRRRRLRGRRAARAHRALPLPDLPQDPWHGLLVGDGRAARKIPLDARRGAARRLRILARQVPPLLHADAARTSWPSARRSRSCCCGWAASTRRSPTGPQVHIWRSDAAPWYDPKKQFPEKPEGLT